MGVLGWRYFMNPWRAGAFLDATGVKEAMGRSRKIIQGVAFAMSVAGLTGFAQQSKLPADDLTPGFKAPVKQSDFEKRVVMVPMRDGTKLYTVIVVPNEAKGAPILLTRTPYNAASRAARSKSGRMIEALPLSDENFVEAGYIRVYQDVRGKYGSEGVYLMTPPPVNSGYNPSGADDTTDAYDTIDWLVKNVPESNGRVGMIGSSYEGFTVVMALLNPHPALKVAAPESPMIDGWMGDDWFHYGAFRQPTISYVLGQTTNRGEGVSVLHKAGTTTRTICAPAPPTHTPGPRAWSSCRTGVFLSNTPPTTASGKARRSIS